MPMSALITPCTASRISALVMTRSSDSASQRRGRLPHAVADHFAAAKFHLVAIAAALRDEIALDLDEKLRVREPHLVAHGRAEHLGVLAAGESERHVSVSCGRCASSVVSICFLPAQPLRDGSFAGVVLAELAMT